MLQIKKSIANGLFMCYNIDTEKIRKGVYKTMEQIMIHEVPIRQYQNNGMHIEQSTAYTLTGEIRKHDNVPYYIGSDIEEHKLSVKSAKFTLANAKSIKGATLDEQLAYYMEHTASEYVIYVTKNFVGYKMNLVEFADFVKEFCYLTRESTKNGGGLKVMAKSESKKMLEWLAVRI